jgi:FkbM family methyltransferase
MINPQKNLIIPDIPNQCNIIKIDIGLSNEAVHSSVWLHQQPNLFVFGFEPLPSACNNLMSFKGGNNPRHLQKKHINRIQIYQTALSNVEKPTKRKFYVNNFDTGCSGFYKPKKNSFMDNIREEIEVNVWSLNMWFIKFFQKYSNRFNCIHHIKIDAQGEDLEIAKGAGKWLKEKVVYITLEADGGYYEDIILDSSHLDKYMIDELGFMRVDHHKVQDPTYLNPKFIHLKEIYIHQNGDPF